MTDNDTITRSKISRYLESKHTLSLSTCADNIPWACSVLYVSDKELQLFFLTDPETLHGQQLAAGRVAATINENCKRWDEIKGIQLVGTAAIVTGTERENGLSLYLEKFPDVRQTLLSPRNDSEKLIAEKLKATPLYQISIDWIRLIDNSEAFGTKIELNNLQLAT
jgi:uncharacterized protein YhbP (UPF0306 family)